MNLRQNCQVGAGKLAMAGLVLILISGSRASGQVVLGGLGGKPVGGAGTNGIGTMTVTLPDVPQPGVSVKLTNESWLFITITNAASFANYELYYRPSLDVGHVWKLDIVGGQGQSNFLVGVGSQPMEFYQVCVGSDWDRDGVTNYCDADPLNASVGILNVSIAFPTSNSVVQ